MKLLYCNKKFKTKQSNNKFQKSKINCTLTKLTICTKTI